MLKRRHRAKDRTDPLEPIIGARLGAALDAANLSRRSAAEEQRRRARKTPRHLAVGHVTPQSLDYLVSGRVRRCRLSVLLGLARLLRVPPDWLAGRWKYLPPPRVVLGPRGDGAPALPLPPGAGVFDQLPVYPAASLAQHRFVQRCLRRFEEDLGQEKENGASPEELALLAAAAVRVFSTLVEPYLPQGYVWRGHPLDRDWGELDEKAEAAAVQGLCSAWESILEPWFNRRMALCYAGLREWTTYPERKWLDEAEGVRGLMTSLISMRGPGKGRAAG